MEINEGAKLARKVDHLRETAAIEESRLSKFRTESLKTTKAEIDSLIKRRTTIEKELAVLEEKKRLLKIPLDQEWEKVKQESHDLKIAQNKLVRDQEAVINHQNKIEDREKGLILEESRVEDEKARADTISTELSYKLDEVNVTLADLEDQKYDLGEYIKTKNNELFSREAALAVNERQLGLREETLLQAQKDLENKEKMINDRYNQLLKTESRMKKHV